MLEIIELVQFSLSAVLSSNLIFSATSDVPQLVLLLLRVSPLAQKVLELIHSSGDNFLLVN